MMFNIMRTLNSSKRVRLLITSNQTCPEEGEVTFKSRSLGKKHASSALPQIIKEIYSYKPDYVFTTSSSIGYILVLTKYVMFRHRLKVVIRCAVPPSESYFNGIKSKILRYIIKMTYRGADVIIAQTEYMKHDLINAFNLSSDKVRHIRNIVDTNLLDIKSNEFVPKEYVDTNFNIIAAGALYSVKGFDLLIKAFSKIDYTQHNVHLYIIGKERYEIGYEKYLTNLIRNLNLASHVHLLGHKFNPFPYIKNANLLVMSSRKEGFPNVVLEALYLKTPVIATDCVDWADIVINGINGYVVRKDNLDSLVKALQQSISTYFDLSECQLNNYDYNQLFV